MKDHLHTTLTLVSIELLPMQQHCCLSRESARAAPIHSIAVIFKYCAINLFYECITLWKIFAHTGARHFHKVGEGTIFS